MPSDAASGGHARSPGLTPEERTLLYRDEWRKGAGTPPVATGKRSVEADNSASVLEYLRKLRGLSIEAAAQKTGLPVTTLQRIENGSGVASLIGSEKAKLASTFHRSAEDLARPLNDETKAAALHGTPMPKKESA
jgi:DNA-binding XRE family transcriptional regulator